MLHEGDIWFDHFRETTIESPDYQSFLEKVEATADYAAFKDREWGARVTVETAEGRYVENVDAPQGSAENPMTWAELEEKFRRCAAIGLPDDAVEPSLETLRALPDIDDVTVVIDQLT